MNNPDADSMRKLLQQSHPGRIVRGMKLANTIFCAVLLGLLLSCPSPAVAEGPGHTPVVEIRGDSAELGAQHGTLLGPQVRLLQEKYLNVYLRTDQVRAAALAGSKAFEPFIAPEHLAEVRGLSSTSGVDEPHILMAQCFLDLQAMTACSTIALPAGASPDGVARFGRNLDFPGLSIAENNSVLLIVHPKDRYAFAAVSWPGLIGVLSGMNERGLALANMEVSRKPRMPSAMPYTLLYRTVLEKCKTVSEAITLLEATPKQTANNLMLMDASGDRAVVEITPENITVRRAPETMALISTNHQRGEDLQTPGKCVRYDRLLTDSTGAFGKIEESTVQKMLQSVAQPTMTMQSMVFEPSTRVLYLATGPNAPSRGYERIALKEYFAK